jgi:hypothetical protein
MRIIYGGDALDNIASWIREFEGKQLRMPESIDELLEKLPQYKRAFENYQRIGYIVNYTYIDMHSMNVKVQDGEDIYECYNKQRIYYYFRNSTFIREYDVELYKNMPPPIPPVLLEDSFGMDGGIVLDIVAEWIMSFKNKKLRMPESLEEMLQYRDNLESFKKMGYIINYTYIDMHSMNVKVQDGEDIYECNNKLNFYYFFRNGTLSHEINADTFEKLHHPRP